MELNKRANNFFDDMPVRPKHMVCFFLVAGGYFFDMFDSSVFSYTAPNFLEYFGLEMTFLGKVSSLYFIAMLAGAISGGIISDRIGRKKTYIAAGLLMTLSMFLSGFCNSSDLFLICRVITGYAVNVVTIVSYAYISEMSPAESRGKWQGYISTIALFALPLTGLTIRHLNQFGVGSWRYAFFIGGIGLAFFLFGVKYIKESPRWLVLKGRVAEAEKIIKELSGEDVDLSEIAQKLTANTQKKQTILQVLVQLCSRKYVKTVILLAIVWSLWNIATIGVNQWTVTLLTTKGFTTDQSVLIQTLMNFGPICGAFLSSIISDKGGRKIPFAVITIAFLGANTWFGFTGTDFVMTVVSGFVRSVLPTTASFLLSSYVAEQFPTHIRNSAVGWLNGFAMLTLSLIQPFLAGIFNQIGFGGVFLSFGILAAIAGMLVLVFGANTAKRALEDTSREI
jgi:putative MFS transporter